VKPHARLASAAVVTAFLAGNACSFQLGSSPPPAQRAEIATVSACRARADEVFQRQNRDQVYRVDTYNTDTRDAPFATNGLKGVTSAGLSQQYGRDNMVEDCLRSSNAGPQPPMSRDIHGNNPGSP
jgi:hypothetical protein